jgi:hypothetical protein
MLPDSFSILVVGKQGLDKSPGRVFPAARGEPFASRQDFA